MTTVADIFGKSPVMPLEKHIGLAVDAAAELPAFFRAAIAGDWEQATACYDKINTLEHEADALKRDIRLSLPRSLFMPVPREDILGLLTAQDEIANKTKQIASVTLARLMSPPEEIAELLLAFVERNVDAARQAGTTIRELDELFTTGFRGAEAELVTRMISELDAISSDTDSQHFELLRKVRALESTLDPVSAVFLYKTVSQTAKVGFKAEQVGRRLELLLSR